GLLSSFVGLSSAVFDAGGSVTITSGGTLGAATSGGIPNGTTIFSGAFSGPTTLTQVIGGGYPGCQPTVKYCYLLSGPVSGSLDPAVLSYFSLGSSPGATGFLLTFAVGFNDSGSAPDNFGQIEAGAASVVVPEPGTLALFGTGLIAVAGFIRRRIKA
ncbi:MAG TPA: PEP-CTERM sorting domain-containing protein, partial [Candidatus Acidoferrales bacterium]|nr:PEP-CTERM sorting domain-containing protein [Candidatus Acidoferrales bacterium]